MEAAGVEPASASGSYRASTCVASLSVSPGAASEQPTPRLATWYLVPGRGSTNQRPARLIDVSETRLGQADQETDYEPKLRSQCQFIVGN